jgi:Carboxypeptidase regulatory-like domain
MESGTYTPDYSTPVLTFMWCRTEETHAGVFLPRLHVLDAGCGPRTITLELAVCTLVLLSFVPRAGIAQEQMAPSSTRGTSFADALPQRDDPMQNDDTNGDAQETASISGTVLDGNGTAISGAQVTLTDTAALEQQTQISGADGEFAFTKVPTGTYFVSVQAKGFLSYTSAKFTVATRQVYVIPEIQLAIAPVKTVVVVRPTEVIAQMQIKAQEKQRALGVFPNFYTSYVWNAAPLNTKQKFSLSAREIFDPVSLLGVAATAGIEQANNSFAGYGQGAAGYGKRFAAALGDNVIGSLLSQAVFASVFHQDPRYFYQGSGSVKSRLIHALSWPVIARADNGSPVPSYSSWVGDLAAEAISNLYYPRANRGVSLVFTNFGIDLARRAGEALVQEFILKHLTTNVHGKGKP